MAGYALNGGGFNNYLGALRSRGLIKGDGDRLTITDAGIEVLGTWEPLPTGSALVDYWRGRLGKAERLILETLTQAYPDGLTKEEVAAKAGYEANGGGFNNALGRLRTLELVEDAEKSRPATTCSMRWPDAPIPCHRFRRERPLTNGRGLVRANSIYLSRPVFRSRRARKRRARRVNIRLIPSFFG